MSETSTETTVPLVEQMADIEKRLPTAIIALTICMDGSASMSRAGFVSPVEAVRILREFADNVEAED